MSAGGGEEPRRISPAITFQFEEFASRICDKGKVDFADRPYRLREWTGRMEEWFRTIVADGRTTDEDAAQAAIALFGPAENVVKMLLGGPKELFHRLLYSQNYFVHRLASPMVFCYYHSWLRSSGSLEFTIYSNNDLTWRFIGFCWEYYIGVISLAIIVITREVSRILRMPKLLGQISAMGISLALFARICSEWIGSLKHLFHTWDIGPRLEHVPRWKNDAFGTFLLVLFLIEALSFFFVLALVTSEIFELSSKKRTRAERRRFAK